jgi:hypothetical protein
MSGHYYDGTPSMAGTEKPQNTGHYPQFSIVGLRQGVITERFFPDEDGNRSRTYVEYRVRDIQTGDVYEGVVKLSQTMGFEDGEEDVLHPATKNHDPNNLEVFKKTSKANNTDGQKVLLGFIEGSRNRAVILGAYPHSKMAYGARAADGERRHYVHKGTSRTVGSDGSYLVARNTTGADGNEKTASLQIDAGGAVQMNSGRGAVLTLDEENATLESTVNNARVAAQKDVYIQGLQKVDVSGDNINVEATQVVTLEAGQIKLGAAALSGVMLGTTFNTMVAGPLKTSVDVLASLAAALVVDPTGVNVAANAVVLQALIVNVQLLAQAISEAMFNVPAAISSKVKSE